MAITGARAYDIASSWGSYMNGGDPGAVFYGFESGSNFYVQSEDHRRKCLAYASDCIEVTRHRADDKAQSIVDRAELRMLKRKLRTVRKAGESVFDGLDDFTRGYVEAAIWTDCNPDNEETCDMTAEDLSPRTRADFVATCTAFQRDNAADLAEAVRRGRALDHLGHDLWLTSRGAGAGFWDRSELDAGGLGRRLSDASGRLDSTLVRGDDGMLYCE